jgi:hypothetical protein
VQPAASAVDGALGATVKDKVVEETDDDSDDDDSDDSDDSDDDSDDDDSDDSDDSNDDDDDSDDDDSDDDDDEDMEEEGEVMEVEGRAQAAVSPSSFEAATPEGAAEKHATDQGMASAACEPCEASDAGDAKSRRAACPSPACWVPSSPLTPLPYEALTLAAPCPPQQVATVAPVA